MDIIKIEHKFQGNIYKTSYLGTCSPYIFESNNKFLIKIKYIFYWIKRFMFDYEHGKLVLRIWGIKK